MNILFFDTETSGLWRDKLPATDPAQPHLLQLSAMLIDESRVKRADVTLIARPNGWSIEPEAQAVHGISESIANRIGVSEWILLMNFRAMVEQASVIVAHNAQFDRQIISASTARAKANAGWWNKRSNSLFCTMEESAEIIGLAGPIKGVAKYPKLEEAHAFFYPDFIIPRVHDAKYDRDACARIYWALMERRNASHSTEAPARL